MTTRVGDYSAKEGSLSYDGFVLGCLTSSHAAVWSTFATLDVPDAIDGETLSIHVNFKHFPLGARPSIGLQYSIGEEPLTIFHALPYLSAHSDTLRSIKSRCEDYCRKRYDSVEKPLWKEHYAREDTAQKPSTFASAGGKWPKSKK